MAHHLGVRYRFSKSGSGAAGPRRAVPRLESLAGLPEELRAELEEAVVGLKVERVAGIIQRVSELDATLGSELRYWEGRLEYTVLLDAIVGCKTIPSE